MSKLCKCCKCTSASSSSTFYWRRPSTTPTTWCSTSTSSSINRWTSTSSTTSFNRWSSSSTSSRGWTSPPTTSRIKGVHHHPRHQEADPHPHHHLEGHLLL